MFHDVEVNLMKRKIHVNHHEVYQFGCLYSDYQIRTREELEKHLPLVRNNIFITHSSTFLPIWCPMASYFISSANTARWVTILSLQST